MPISSMANARFSGEILLITIRGIVTPRASRRQVPSEVYLEDPAVIVIGQVGKPIVGDIEIHLRRIIVRIARRCECNIFYCNMSSTDRIAIGAQVDRIENRPGPINDPNVRAETSADKENVMLGVVG